MPKDDGLRKNDQGAEKGTKKKLDFFSLYEQLETSNPALVENKPFWSRKGNGQKYICSLCNISVEMSKNLNLVKTSVLAHVQDKCHKKRFAAYMAQNGSNKNISDLKGSVTENNIVKKSSNTDEHLLAPLLALLTEEGEENVGSGSLKNIVDKQNGTNCIENQLVDFNTIYNTFEARNPVVKTSKQYIIKQEDGRHFTCTLCNVLVFNSLNANEFRYNLWVHLNDEDHRKMLPNFDQVRKEFNKVVGNLCTVIPNNLKSDVEYFEIGPVFRFLKCSLCEIAVSVNLHRLENHIKDKDHAQRKLLKGKENKEPLSNRTRDAFRKLVVKIEDKYKKDIKYVRIGKMPGYIICSLCTYVVLPTQHYLQTHFESDAHLNNKANSTVNRHAKFKVSLEDLMKTLPKDLQDYNIFQENMCGLTCQRCHESIPATSYDLYSHINKERHACSK